jgi:hypothetical protein
LEHTQGVTKRQLRQKDRNIFDEARETLLAQRLARAQRSIILAHNGFSPRATEKPTRRRTSAREKFYRAEPMTRLFIIVKAESVTGPTEIAPLPLEA